MRVPNDSHNSNLAVAEEQNGKWGLELYRGSGD